MPEHPDPLFARSGDDCFLEWTGKGGTMYFVQRSLDLQEWEYLPVVQRGDGSVIRYGIPCEEGRMFVRLQYVKLAPDDPDSDDLDGDGISNWDEVRDGGTGTSPLLEDTDGNGVRDDGLVYAARNDPDGAGLSESLHDGLLGRWDFEQYVFAPPTLPYFPDKTGNNYHATAHFGSMQEVDDGVVSRSCKIPGAGYLSIPSAIMRDVRMFNLSMWIKPAKGSLTGVNAAKPRVIWSYGDSQVSLPLLFLYLRNGKDVILQRYNGGVVEDVASWRAPDNLDDGVWRHVCLTRENGGATGTRYKLYLNGVQIGAAWGGSNHAFGNHPDGYFLIGRLAASNVVTQFDGLLDRVLFHDRALTQVEVQELYNSDVDSDGLFDRYELKYNKDRVFWQDDPNGDPDRDHLTNLVEQAAGTDMRDADSDNDLLPDGFEVTYGLCPLDGTGENGANGDPDGDTLVNLEEFVHGSAPDNPDTDGDNTDDNVEVANMGLPNDPSDNGKPANPDDVIRLQLGVGDPSDSESERYTLLVKDLGTGRTVVSHVSPVFGEVNERIYDKFRRGHSYSFSVKHLDTEDGKTPDYDYFSEVRFVVPADASKYVWFDPFDSGKQEIVMPANGQKVLMNGRAAGGEPVGTGSGGSQDFVERIEPLEALLVTADLDIDSNNNEGFVFEQGSREEDAIEAAAGLPGKVVPVNGNDTDGVPDWADGFDVNPADTHDDVLTEVDFVPFLLALPGGYLSAEDVEVVFRYDASNPAEVAYVERGYTVDGMSDYDYALPEQGSMRIWTKNADEMRKKGSVTDSIKGDFVPKDVRVLWSDLAETGENRAKLYLEAVKGAGLKDITVDVFYKGSQIIGEADKINVTLLDVEMVPDYNRDGKIDAADRGRVSAVNPWRWWINDDGDTVGGRRGENTDDIPGKMGDMSDTNNVVVDGVRDLIDFFPLHLDLKNALSILPKDTYKYVLKHRHDGLKFFEYPEVVLDGSEPNNAPDTYYKSVSRAIEFENVVLKQATSTSGNRLSDAALNAFKEGKGVLLMEGHAVSSHPLSLEIVHRELGTVAAKFDLCMNIANVEDMYRHVNMRDIEGGEGGNATQTGEPPAYPDRLTNGKYVAYVHGYNVSGESARGSQSNIFKRFYHLGNRARYIGVSWYGDPPNPGFNLFLPPDYHRALYNGLITGLVARTRLQFIQDSDLTILAHSLGNSVVSNAIANHNLDVDKYFIINGAIALEAYDAAQTTSSSGQVDMKRRMTEDDWKPYYDYGGNGHQHRLFAANWHELFRHDPADRRNELTWKNIFDKPQLLNVAYNFYSPDDEVVENAGDSEQFGKNIGHILLNWQFTRHAWVNQEIAKGGKNSLTMEAFYELNGGWEFNYKAPSEGDPGHGYFKEDPAEIGGYRKFSAAEAASDIRDAELRTKPFHRRFSFPNLYDPVLGRTAAGVLTTKYQVLATSVPAMSFAIAANSSRAINPARNFNMPGELKNPVGQNLWPQNSVQDHSDDWLHSDFKDVAMPFVYPMYQKMIDLAELDEE